MELEVPEPEFCVMQFYDDSGSQNASPFLVFTLRSRSVMQISCRVQLWRENESTRVCDPCPSLLLILKVGSGVHESHSLHRLALYMFFLKVCTAHKLGHLVCWEEFFPDQSKIELGCVPYL